MTINLVVIDIIIISAACVASLLLLGITVERIIVLINTPSRHQTRLYIWFNITLIILIFAISLFIAAAVTAWFSIPEALQQWRP